MDEHEKERGGLPKYTGTDSPVWKAQVFAYLVCKGKSSALTESKPRRIITLGAAGAPPTAEQQAERDKEIQTWVDNDNYVKSLILLHVDSKHVKLIVRCTTAAQMWERLSSMYEESSNANRVLRQQEFFGIKLQKDESVKDYVGRAEYLFGQLQDMGVAGINEVTLVNTIVSGLTGKYFTFISNWALMEPARQTLSTLIAHLTAEEQLVLKYRTKPRVEHAHYSDSRPGTGGKGGQSKPKPGSSKSKSSSKSARSCWNCGKPGHLKSECRSAKTTVDKTQTSKDMSKKCSIQSNSHTEEGVSMVAEEANFVSARYDEPAWILDTGATCHMTFSRADFITYRTLGVSKLIKFGGDQTGEGVGEGDVNIIAVVGDQETLITLRNVLHVPKLRRKLLSISSATAHGWVGQFEHDKIILRDASGVDKLVANRLNGLYVAQTTQAEALLNENYGSLDLWHERLGHVNKRFLVKTAEAVVGMEKMKQVRNQGEARSIDCIGCVMGKMRKEHTPLRSTPRATEVGQVFHSDIGGPIGVKTVEGEEYYISYKDEYSNYRYV